MSVDQSRLSAGEPPVRSWLRLLWMAGFVYSVASAAHPGAHGRHAAALVLTVTTALGFGSWLVARDRRDMPWSLVGIVVMTVSGGVLVVLSPIGVLVVGVAGLCAASLLDVVPAALVTLPGVVAAAIAVAIRGHDPANMAGAASGMAAGLVIGMGRRQSTQRVRQDAELAIAQQRSEVEHERAELLADRNRIAREVHDVLAHTLSALSVQLEALGSLVESTAGDARIGETVDRSRRLVVEGLEETRRAVRVLREEPVDVADQVTALAGDGVEVDVLGEPRELRPAAGLAIVRIAQEAVTNARKHAVGAAVRVTLTFRHDATELTVTNATTAASPMAATGGGYGLQGMRERIELTGGSLAAGPDGGAWRVHAEVPA